MANIMSRDVDSKLYEAPSRLVYLPLFVMAGLVLLLIPVVGAIPDQDYWYMLSDFVQSDRLEVTLHAIWQKSNEHTVAIPKLLYLTNLYLTGGDSRGLTVLVWGFLLLSGYMLATVMRQQLASKREAIFFGTVVAVAAFTPLAAHNFFMGMSGVAWVGANALTLSAMCVMYQVQMRPDISIPHICASILLVFLASQTYSTGVFGICILAMQAILVRKTRALGFVLLVVGVLLAITMLIIMKPEFRLSEVAPRTYNPFKIVSFLLEFLGGGLTTELRLALWIGALGVLATFWLVVRIVAFDKQFSPYVAFWVGVSGYAGLAGLFAAIGRSSIGGEMALSSRYGTLPALFWLALLNFYLWRKSSFRVSRMFKSTGIIFSVLAIWAVAFSGMGRLKSYQSRADSEMLAALALYLNVNDPMEIMNVSLSPGWLIDSRTALISMRHVPFNGIFNDCPKIGEVIAYRSTVGSRSGGKVDSQESIPDAGWVKLAGSVVGPTAHRYGIEIGDCIAIVNNDSRVVGLAVAIPGKTDSMAIDWVGYVKTGQSSLKVLTKTAKDSRWQQLVQEK